MEEVEAITIANAAAAMKCEKFGGSLLRADFLRTLIIGLLTKLNALVEML